MISIHKVSSGQIELEAFQNISDICITGVCVCAAGTGSITVGFFNNREGDAAAVIQEEPGITAA